MKPTPNGPCPCGSQTKFKHCCRPFHRGAPAPNPEALMRSRYAAYAVGEVEYILDTTDPDGPLFEADRDAWAAHVRAFCERTRFEGLSVLEEEREGDRGWVAFRAQLSQGSHDASFGERSTFQLRGGRWLYHSGQRL